MKPAFTHAQLEQLMPAPGQGYDWPALCQLASELRALETAPQDRLYHAEGNVGIHTRMVLDALLDDAFYQAADAATRFRLFTGALLHDIAKPLTTRIDEHTGRISQPGHARKGAIDARRLLWLAGTPFEQREGVCRIIESHQAPFFAFASRTGDTPERIARTLSWKVRLPELLCVARADMRGRRYAGQASSLQDIDLFELLARGDGCWDGPKAAADAHTRMMYARGAELHLETPLFHERGSEVIVMCGLPASGKNTWVARHAPQLPVVSFDDAKAELGLRHGENDGAAAHLAIDRAKALLRAKTPFVWNATHLSEQMRGKTIDLLVAYGAVIRIVYLEVAPTLLFSRNDRRDTTLRNADIERMLHRWEIPAAAEAHEVGYLVSAP